MKKGRVYLVGAGPGDPGLITVKGLECLKHAGVVIYDHLLDESLLEAAPADAEKIYVGKSAGDHALEQDEINRMLVEKARAGKNVVRLKGGDPFVFGRGGEEAGFLVENGVEFEVVPGVSSAVAVPAYAGIPVTHRGTASSFAVVTGHEEPGKETSAVNWEHLTNSVDTLVFLMGRQNLPQIVTKLVDCGRAIETPIAVIRDGTRPGQETVTGTLGNIVARVEEKGMKPPVIIVVGEVVDLRERLRWFDNRPLSGKRVLVTRARHQASKFSQLLAERGAVPVELPAIEIQSVCDGELASALRSIDEYDWLMMTSANGVESLFSALVGIKLDARALYHVKIGAIGPATAQALAGRGIAADYIPAEFSAAGIIAGLQNGDVRGKRFLLVRADIADTELVAGLTGIGAQVHEVTAYRTVPATECTVRAKHFLQEGMIDIISFTSSSTVCNLVTALGNNIAVLENVTVACIGPKTAETAERLGLKVHITAAQYTIPGLVVAIEEYYKQERKNGLS